MPRTPPPRPRACSQLLLLQIVVQQAQGSLEDHGKISVRDRVTHQVLNAAKHVSHLA
jgi:hypothetical protein